MRSERGHTRRGAILLGALGACSCGLLVSPARAQEPAPPPLEAPVVPEAPPVAAPTPPQIAAPPPPAPVVVQEPPRARPRLSAAVGMGVSLDDSGLTRTEAIPSFFATGGVGVDWPVGFELGGFSSAAQGRYTGTAIDRLALDAFGVVRPFAWSVSAADTRYRARLVRATGVELGVGLERDGTTTNAGARFGLHTGVRFEAPLGLPGYASELRLRLAARYMVGFYSPRVQTVDVGNSLELYAALVTVF